MPIDRTLGLAVLAVLALVASGCHKEASSAAPTAQDESQPRPNPDPAAAAAAAASTSAAPPTEQGSDNFDLKAAEEHYKSGKAVPNKEPITNIPLIPNSPMIPSPTEMMKKMGAMPAHAEPSGATPTQKANQQ